MNHKRTIIALAVITMAIASMSLVMSDNSDARMTFEKIEGVGFTTANEGTLFVPLTNGGEEPLEITITVTEDGRLLKTDKVTVGKNSTVTAELRFKLNGTGDHQLRVTFTPAEYFPPITSGGYANSAIAHVNVSESIWSKTTTYLAIVAIALLIVIAAYMKIRSAPAGKPGMTFTELEKQKRESREEEEDRPKASATEKRRYRESEESSKAAQKQQAPPEKKAGTFTELENQKKADATAKKGPEPPPKKAEPAPKKAKPQEEPKKLKYVSSRRK
jgi:hypothetical protein